MNVGIWEMIFVGLPEASRPRKWAQPTGHLFQVIQPDFLPEECGPRVHLRRKGYGYSLAGFT
jgi:hypothetical protein